jgi:heptosyltransferase-2
MVEIVPFDHPKEQSLPISEISRLYVRLPNWVGDVCMSLPSLSLLGSTGIPLVICARPWARDLLSGIDSHDFIPMRGRAKEDWLTTRQHRKQSLTSKAVVRGITLPDSLSSAAVFRLAGIPVAGYRDDGRSFLLKWPINKPTSSMHAVESWFNLTRLTLEQWGFPQGNIKPANQLNLPITHEQHTMAEDILRQAELSNRPFTLIAPTATGLHKGKIKVWPHFDALTRSLQSRGHIVVMCPPPNEIEEAQRNAPTAQLLPSMSLGAFAALTTRAKLVVCNDSGVSHIAAAANARQLSLFGVTSPHRTGPWSPSATCLGSEGNWPTLAEAEQVACKLLQSA